MINNKESNFVSVVAYLRNNEAQIKNFIEKVSTVIKNNFNKYEFIFVDDNCTDKTVELAKSLCKNIDCTVNIIKMGNFQGIEKSLSAGTDLAIGDYVFEFETISLDYNADLLMQAYSMISDGNDIVSISPNKTTGRTKLFYDLYNLGKFSTTKIYSTRVRLISRRAINRVSSLNTKVTFRKSAFAESGLKSEYIFFVPETKIINHHKEDKGLVNSNAYESLLMFTNTIFRVSTSIFSIFLIAFVGLGIATICLAVYGIKITDLMIVLLVLTLSFTAVIGLLCFIIKYISLIVYSQYKKKEYVIEGIEKLNVNE